MENRRASDGAKRLFDLALAGLLLLPGLPLMAVLGFIVVIQDGSPALYPARRIGRHRRPFTLWKFRTMAQEFGPEIGVSGGDKSHRITALGRKLRSSRADELPQLLNVVIGQMSFVGPRPPVKDYVDDFAEIYAVVLQEKPGITGLATVMFHAREEQLLATCRTAEETDAIYRRRCVPRKAHLDRIYAANRSLWLDLYILYLTGAKILPLPGARARRLRNRDNASQSPQSRPKQTQQAPRPAR